MTGEKEFDRVVTYPPPHVKSEWEEEAGDQSLSQWVQERVAEARVDHHVETGTNQAEIDRLKSKIDRLEAELEEERNRGQYTRDVADPDVLKQFLTHDPQPLDELIQRIVESGRLQEFLVEPVESRLYSLADKGEVKYSRTKGRGWKLTETSQPGGTDV